MIIISEGTENRQEQEVLPCFIVILSALAKTNNLNYFISIAHLPVPSTTVLFLSHLCRSANTIAFFQTD